MQTHWGITATLTPFRYYEKITDAIKSKDQPLKESALPSLEIDTGIHTLVPYFMQFIADEVLLCPR